VDKNGIIYWTTTTTIHWVNVTHTHRYSTNHVLVIKDNRKIKSPDDWTNYQYVCMFANGKDQSLTHEKSTWTHTVPMYIYVSSYRWLIIIISKKPYNQLSGYLFYFGKNNNPLLSLGRQILSYSCHYCIKINLYIRTHILTCHSMRTNIISSTSVYFTPKEKSSGLFIMFDWHQQHTRSYKWCILYTQKTRRKRDFSLYEKKETNWTSISRLIVITVGKCI
jgi:hypothetical protein